MKINALGKSCFATKRCYSVISEDGTRWIGNGRALWMTRSRAAMDEDLLREMLALDEKKKDAMQYGFRTMDECDAADVSEMWMVDGRDVPARVLTTMPFDGHGENGVTLITDETSVYGVWNRDIEPVKGEYAEIYIARTQGGRAFVRLMLGFQVVAIVCPMIETAVAATLFNMAKIAEMGAGATNDGGKGFMYDDDGEE